MPTPNGLIDRLNEFLITLSFVISIAMWAGLTDEMWQLQPHPICGACAIPALAVWEVVCEHCDVNVLVFTSILLRNVPCKFYTNPTPARHDMYAEKNDMG